MNNPLTTLVSPPPPPPSSSKGIQCHLSEDHLPDDMEIISSNIPQQQQEEEDFVQLNLHD